MSMLMGLAKSDKGHTADQKQKRESSVNLRLEWELLPREKINVDLAELSSGKEMWLFISEDPSTTESGCVLSLQLDYDTF